MLKVIILNSLRRQGLEYTDCISCRVARAPPEEKVSWEWLNCNWWWGSSSGDMESEKYTFIAITPGSTLTLSGNTGLGLTYELYRFVEKLSLFDWNTRYRQTENYAY